MARPFDHARQRAKERYDANLEPVDLARLAQEIEAGRAQYVQPAWGGRSIHIVFCAKAGRRIPVVYDAQATDKIVTVLPDDAKQLGRLRRPKRLRAFREIDPDDLHIEAVPPCPDALPHDDAGPNNILADALERALQEAGLAAPLAQSSHSAD